MPQVSRLSRMPYRRLQERNCVTGLQPPAAYNGPGTYVHRGERDHDMPTTPIASATAARRRATRPRRAGFLLAALVSLALLAAACGGASAGTAAKAGSTMANEGGSAQGGGVVTRGGQGPGSGSGQESAGTFTVAFARCMRAHGAPKFPTPNGHGGQLGPGSGVNPTSPAFQAAINGPCRSLAPPGWVSSGPVSKGGGS